MVMKLTAEQSAWFARMRAEWFEVMKPFDGYGPSALFQPLPILPSQRFADCRVLASRQDVLSLLPKGGRVAEVGTQEGRFADLIVQINQPSEIHLFDIDFAPLHRREDAHLLKSAILHEGDSSTMLSRLPDDHFDWIYIDGDHSYAGVVRDIEIARTKVKPGGYLVFNDFVMWSPVECAEYGVPQAVCELSQNFGFEFKYFALHPLMYCDVTLQRPAS
ncbi:class I SAM-dependent methyltransferase [Aminobacter sp. BE322]|uniref:class I SAM-dependent methyltransferase n=1 Tax=unclassified Aminobacter TaxID=2644704 RepID=UPI003D19C089